jgi:type IV secretory pathway TraG/TraD family ATPase VirD4
MTTKMATFSFYIHKLSSGGRTESTQISEEGQPLVLPQDIGSLSPDDNNLNL